MPKRRPKVYRYVTVNPSQDDEEELRRLVANHENCPEFPLKGQLSVKLRFYQRIPSSTSKWRINAMEKGMIRPNKHPDLDNYVKLTLDALNGLLWEDDRYIVEIHSIKFYSLQPRIEIELEQLPEYHRKSDLQNKLDDYF